MNHLESDKVITNIAFYQIIDSFEEEQQKKKIIAEQELFFQYDE